MKIINILQKIILVIPRIILMFTFYFVGVFYESARYGFVEGRKWEKHN